MLRSLEPLEHHEQALYFRWLVDVTINGKALRPHCYAVPNQKGTRHTVDVMKLAAQGVTPGVPDICVDVPSGQYHGLRLEAKRRSDGRTSTAQLEMLQHRRDMGYQALVGEGFDDLRAITLTYLKLSWRVLDRWRG